eukprot:3269781-Rhodomonas_salina.1
MAMVPCGSPQSLSLSTRISDVPGCLISCKFQIRHHGMFARDVFGTGHFASWGERKRFAVVSSYPYTGTIPISAGTQSRRLSCFCTLVHNLEALSFATLLVAKLAHPSILADSDSEVTRRVEGLGP